MTTYNTGNPVGSSDPRDLYDNAQNLDNFLNGPLDTYKDRVGADRLSYAAVEKRIGSVAGAIDAIVLTTEQKVDSLISDSESVLSNFLESNGYEFLGDYSSGITVTARNQLIRESGEFWRVSASESLPLTTSGSGMPEGGRFVPVGDGYLRQQLFQPIATYDTVTQMSQDGTLVAGRKARTLGYHSPGDGGGNDYMIVSGSSGTADGGSLIELGNGLLAKGTFPGSRIDSRQFGAQGTGNETEIYQKAVDYAVSSGVRFINVEIDHDTPMNIYNRSNVIFVGSGSFSGTNQATGSYRRQVVPTGSPYAGALPDAGMNLTLNRMGRVKVVITGDSLTSFDAHAPSPSEGFSSRISAALSRANPSVDFSFIGRGIGGQTWATLDSVPSVSVDPFPWYNNPSRPWLDYIFDESPDFVVVSLGVNDSNNFSRTAFESVISKIEATGARVILATNIVPSLSPHPDNSSYGTYEGQEGRDRVAGFIRTYAQYHGYPLVDMNRTFNLVRDGRDILDTTMLKLAKETYGGAVIFQAPDSQACRDFSLISKVEAGAWDSPNGFMSVSISPETSHTVFLVNSDGFVRLRFFYDGVLYSTSLTDFPTPAGESTIEVTVKSNQFTFRILGAGNPPEPFIQDVIRSGGLFRPRIWYHNSSSGPALTAELSIGIERPYLPLSTDIEMFGDNTTSDASIATRKFIGGGNGINHPSAKGLTLLYGTHFSAQDYACNLGVEVFEDATGKCYRYPDGTQICTGEMAFPGGTTTAEGALFRGQPQVWEFPAPFNAAPVIVGNADSQLTEAMATGVVSGQPDGKFCSARPRSTISSSAPVSLFIKAEGRWT